jgi:hypothetical protein
MPQAEPVVPAVAETPAPAVAVAAPAPAQAPAPAPSPAQAGSSAPTYTIGGKGPGGGTVFTVSNGKGKEVAPESTNVLEDGRFKQTGAGREQSRFTYNGYSAWRWPTIQELQLIYDNLHKPGLIHIMDGWFRSATIDKDGVGFIPGFPEYKMYLAGIGDPYFYFNFTLGERKTEYQITGDFSEYDLLVRDF